jgi:hypothetical protein
LGVESGDVEVRIGQVDEGVKIVVEGMGKGAQGGGLAGTDIASDEGGETFLQGKGETALDFLMSPRGEEVLGGDGTTERGLGEAVVFIQGGHRRSPVQGG